MRAVVLMEIHVDHAVNHFVVFSLVDKKIQDWSVFERQAEIVRLTSKVAGSQESSFAI
jgi:hypothetical protein